ncbi:unnamed protein product [Gongylonema pulchrum]|uniref:Suf domain-containing protein n=1 Tax=Gongylonema pulchrum TaxID=637853 RepID=A0A183EI45_9BILA|nr:unnamed protein product [Gongylonema pulchrum]
MAGEPRAFRAKTVLEHMPQQTDKALIFWQQFRDGKMPAGLSAVNLASVPGSSQVDTASTMPGAPSAEMASMRRLNGINMARSEPFSIDSAPNPGMSGIGMKSVPPFPSDIIVASKSEQQGFNISSMPGPSGIDMESMPGAYLNKVAYMPAAHRISAVSALSKFAPECGMEMIPELSGTG